jgi:hypothetical protein
MYRVSGIIGTRSARAQRAAVLTPLEGLAWTDRAIEAKTYRLRSRWLGRIRELERAAPAGWGQPDWTYMRNCPPFGVMTTQEGLAKPCGKRRVCPFCYAREYVGVMYERLSGFQDSGFDLVETSQVIHPSEPRNPPHQIKKAVTPLSYLGHQHPFDREGAMALVQPLWAGKPRSRPWKVQCRALLLVQAGQPVEVGPRVKVNRLEAGSLKLVDIQRAVARFARYPEWLLDGPPEAVKQYLEDYRSARSFERYGVLRA